MTLRDAGVELGYRVGWSAVRRLPERQAYAVFNRLADTAWRRQGKSVRRLRWNLSQVVGPEVDEAALDELTREGMRSYMRYWCETFRLHDWSREEIVERFICDNEDRLEASLEAGHGVILALPHMGNWDHGGAWACIKHRPLMTVAERLKPEGLYDQFVAYRESLGMTVLQLTGGGSDTFRALIGRLREGGLVCLVADRDLTDRGIEVKFFGGRTKMPVGPAMLAAQTGAALHPVTLRYDGRFQRVDIGDQVTLDHTLERHAMLRDATQQLADVFAAGIVAAPQDWHMMSRVWLDDSA
jgi:lauroyl/myristoyl acyltransferase